MQTRTFVTQLQSKRMGASEHFLGFLLFYAASLSRAKALFQQQTVPDFAPGTPAADVSLQWIPQTSNDVQNALLERAIFPAPARLVTLSGWNIHGADASCEKYAMLNETQCWQKCEQSAKCELVTFGVAKKTGFCCLHQLTERTTALRPQQARHWKLIYEEQPVLHRVEGQVFWGEKIRRFDVDQEEVCSLACTYHPECNVAAYKKTRGVCFLMHNMDVPRNVFDPEFVTFFTELQLKLS
ncbi:uncharacterized protein LOC129580647 [Paramacrobiotus metropolitanus]|uniref:uncharacterized protein LOC129580647 n=1 Tax=Paramacrobiotus metropolitanus TaxID=2943436 RepID=UPI0024459A6E|nr:uncharacterized protein LOC129580647 [Paramacrobiotus metropolitanus]